MNPNWREFKFIMEKQKSLSPKAVQGRAYPNCGGRLGVARG